MKKNLKALAMLLALAYACSEKHYKAMVSETYHSAMGSRRDREMENRYAFRPSSCIRAVSARKRLLIDTVQADGLSRLAG